VKKISDRSTSCREFIQVLELGVVVHSLIIGMSLGASDFPSTVRPLVPALTFHQLFEGIGLGGCIVQVSTLVRFAWTVRCSQLESLVLLCNAGITQ
jgi:hypothetical protein